MRVLTTSEDTCPHGCVYCYAVLNRSLAQENFKQHDPNDEFLFRPPNLDPTEDPPTDPDWQQGRLF